MLVRIVTLSLLLGLLVGTPAYAGNNDFRRGDYDNSGSLALPDAIQLLNHLFAGGAGPDCQDAADVDDSGTLNVADAIVLLGYLFSSGPAPVAPGPNTCGPDPTVDTLGCVAYTCSTATPDPLDVGHLLNRVAHGPTTADVQRVNTLGIAGYLQQQLRPATIDESGNTALNSRVDVLFETVALTEDVEWISRGEFWRYRKGDSAPPTNWADPLFDDSTWLLGQTGIGYGDNDDTTVITDMRYNYASMYIRQSFVVANPATVTNLILRLDYDDGFVAYLNGTEVARANVQGTPPAFDTEADNNHEPGEPEDFTINAALLVPGTNVIAIQGHNSSISSNDFSLIPILLEEAPLAVPPRTEILGREQLQQLTHLRGVYSEKQLQEVMAEFWENHFTTDYDKTADYLSEALNADGSLAMSEGQARREAAQLEYLEYQFFYDNALGNFGNLLRYSASSPAMLIYLDGVSNLKADANENYAREILELHTMGVDNGYDQDDIEELALCFTGWTITKVPAYSGQPFPASVTAPPTDPGFQLADNALIEIGDVWQYFKGTVEPTPDTNGDPTADWADPAFDDSAWLTGATGIGYGDGDDTTVITDMQGAYTSIYLRKDFSVADPAALESLVLEIDYDDGFVAYLNGVEVARSDSMDGRGTPPEFDRTSGGHEAGSAPDTFNLTPFHVFMQPGNNVLAIQVHNSSQTSNDLSMLPRLVERTVLQGGIDTGARSGEWVFRFDPDQHDTSAKTLFPATPFEVAVPAGRVGVDGVLDSLDVIDALIEHPSTAEFLSVKLINKFVSDEISLESLHDQSAPVELRIAVAEAVSAWYSTTPPGNIETVLTAILDPTSQQTEFWAPSHRNAKIRTPLEFVNSSLRALNAAATGDDLPRAISRMGMEQFTRDEPDGWPESGQEWLDTGRMLERLEFIKELTRNDNSDFTWDPAGYLATHGLQTAPQIVDHFDGLLFQGTLSATSRALLVEFAETDSTGQPLPLDPLQADYAERVEELVRLVLSSPLWQAQ